MSIYGLNASHLFAITGGLFLSNQIQHQDVIMCLNMSHGIQYYCCSCYIYMAYNITFCCVMVLNIDDFEIATLVKMSLQKQGFNNVLVFTKNLENTTTTTLLLYQILECLI
jgi:hypothetical protein